jgi:tRNA threonylcarbamoyl adenosine modification protein YeaZ
MITLALEFSSPRRSVAILDCDLQARHSLVLGSSSDEALRTIKPLQLVENALAQTGLEREAIECLVVGLGPGSYTGIRSAIALVQGWQLARSVRLLGISSVECLAAQAHEQKWCGRAHVVIDAQRGELYLGVFEILSSGWREVLPLRLATLEEVRRSSAPDGATSGGRPENGVASAPAPVEWIGPEVQRWFPEGRLLFPDAAALGRLAMGWTDFLPGEKLEPIYLRETNFVKAPPPRSFFNDGAK